MVNYCIYFFLISCLISCTTSNQTVEEDFGSTDSEIIDDQKTICFSLGYPVFNISNDEDVKLLVEKHPNFLKNHFDNYLDGLLVEESFKRLEDNCNYQLIVKELSFKEFKLEVDGPTVNVASVRIDYNFTTPKLDTILSETVNKESIPAFEETIFEEMCKELANKTIEKISNLIEK